MILHFNDSAVIPVMNEKADTIAKAGLELVREYAATASKEPQMKVADLSTMFFDVNTDGYERKNKDFMETLMKYCMEGSDYAFEMKGVLNPQVRRGKFMDRFNAIVSQIITPVIPAVSTMIMNTLAEIRDINYGDSLKFDLEGDELFLVNKIGEGINRGASQRAYKTHDTVSTEPYEITYDLDWYRVATGLFNFGEWAYKVGLSFTSFITHLVYNTFHDVFDNIPAAFKATTFSDSNWLTLGQRVEAANNFSKCYVLGTKVGLGTVVPNDSYIRMALGEEIAKIGYLGVYKGFRLLEMEQMIKPHTLNSTAEFSFDNDRLFFLPVSMQKPIKLVFEGSAYVTDSNYTQTADKTTRFSIQRRLGVGLITASRYGQMKLGL